MDPSTDPAVLSRQYSDDARLRIRVEAHRLYSERSDSFLEWVLERVAVEPGMVVADIGCGYGQYHPRLRHAGRVDAIDPSPGMLDLVRSQAIELGLPVLAHLRDAEALPLEDGSCDRVMCNHALYHVPDQFAALREMCRVVRPGGRVVITTNAPSHLWSTHRLPFTTEDGDRVRLVFPDANLEIREDALLFPSVEAAVLVYESIEPAPEEFVRRAQRAIASQGVFRVPKNSGCFVARMPA